MENFRHRLTGLGLSALASALGLGLAPTAGAQDDAADPPMRVGRIAVLEGNVSFHLSADEPWSTATVNYPIAQAGQLWVEPGGRAEIGLGEARISLDGGSELDIVQFDDQNVVLAVPQGRADIYLHGRHPEEHYVVETPRGNADITEDGHYRIFAGTSDAPTRIAAFRGLAAIAEPQAQLTINRGEEAVISAGEPPAFQVSQAAEDPFDHWGEERERQVTEGVSFHYVSPDMPGAGELDRFGTWRDDPQYGHVWIPTGVDANWAPYRNGHWASVAPWGWTWVDDAPWGFAPFHYGRWAEIGGAWGWVPGEIAAHPVYAPALVAWVGDPGALVGVGVGGVSVGWIPLGPREVWVPPYHTSIDYIRAGNRDYVPPTVINTISVNNITVIHNTTVFANQKHVTVVSQQAFANAQPVQHAVVPVPAAAFSHPIAAAATPAKVLPPPAPAAHPASPGHAVNAPPRAALPIAHPITPTNNLAKLPASPAPTPHGAPAVPAPPVAGGHPPGEPVPHPVPPAPPSPQNRAPEAPPPAHAPAAPLPPQTHAPAPPPEPVHVPAAPPPPQAHAPGPPPEPAHAPAAPLPPQAHPPVPAPAEGHAPAAPPHPGTPPKKDEKDKDKDKENQPH
jgi:hypothetical protein